MSTVSGRMQRRLAPWGLWLVVGAGVLFFSAGCNNNPLGRLKVSGNVRFEGKPLDKGTIDFRPAAGNDSVSSGAVIANGTYEIAVLQGLPPGKYEVRIFSSKEDTSPLPAGPPSGGQRPGIERIPPQFNIQTTQVVEVIAPGPNQFDFDIPAK